MTNNEIAKRIVDRMLETIKTEGHLPWTKPWSKANRSTIRVLEGYTEITVPVRFWSRSGKPYKGINVWLLAMSGHTGEFITFKQAKAEGGKIRKGAKAHEIVYWQMLRKETDELDQNGEKIVKIIPILKYYNVFSLDDVEGLEPKHQPEPEIIRVPRYKYEPTCPDDFIDPNSYDPAAEAIITDYVNRAKTLRVNREAPSNRAYYSPLLDEVVAPNVTQYTEISEYYSTLFHELGHSTGHSSRLNRFTGKEAAAAWGDANYSREELVAEITAASILSMLGMETGNSFRNSAAYVKDWSEHIKNDPMMFVSASGKAEKAIDLIVGGATA